MDAVDTGIKKKNRFKAACKKFLYTYYHDLKYRSTND